MSRKVYTPGPGNSPYGNTPANAPGSAYPTESGYTTSSTLLLQRDIERAIFEVIPQQYYALAILFEKQMLEKNMDEFTFLETTFGRTPAEATSSPVAVAAVPGSEVTQVIAMTADSVTRIQPDDEICYPDGTKALVRSIATLNVTVASQTSQGLPAVTSGDVFSITSALAGDGGTTFSHYDRMEVVERYNYIKLFLRARRWTKMELLKYENAGTTDYLTLDKEQIINQLRTDMFVSFFNGTRGEFKLADTRPAKTMGGIVPTMLAAGAMFGTPTSASLVSQFTSYAFKTNFKKVGGVRFIYGTDEKLYELSKAWKEPGVRYTPNDRIADLNLNEYRLGTQRFVPVVCELFKEPSCFPSVWANRLIVLDQETVHPVKMKGLDAFGMGSTLDKGMNGTREGFKDFYAEANLSLQFNNPLGSFVLDVQ